MSDSLRKMAPARSGRAASRPRTWLALLALAGAVATSSDARAMRGSNMRGSNGGSGATMLNEVQLYPETRDLVFDIFDALTVQNQVPLTLGAGVLDSCGNHFQCHWGYGCLDGVCRKLALERSYHDSDGVATADGVRDICATELGYEPVDVGGAEYCLYAGDEPEQEAIDENLFLMLLAEKAGFSGGGSAGPGMPGPSDPGLPPAGGDSGGGGSDQTVVEKIFHNGGSQCMSEEDKDPFGSCYYTDAFPGMPPVLIYDGCSPGYQCFRTDAGSECYPEPGALHPLSHRDADGGGWVKACGGWNDNGEYESPPFEAEMSEAFTDWEHMRVNPRAVAAVLGMVIHENNEANKVPLMFLIAGANTINDGSWNVGLWAQLNPFASWEWLWTSCPDPALLPPGPISAWATPAQLLALTTCKRYMTNYAVVVYPDATYQPVQILIDYSYGAYVGEINDYLGRLDFGQLLANAPMINGNVAGGLSVATSTAHCSSSMLSIKETIWPTSPNVAEWQTIYKPWLLMSVHTPWAPSTCTHADGSEGVAVNAIIEVEADPTNGEDQPLISETAHEPALEPSP